MVSVTSEVLASASVQSASTRSARPDPSPPAGSDSFATLIDSNASQSDRAQASSQDNFQAPSKASARRRADDSQGTSDNRSRGPAAASDNAPRNDSNDRATTVNTRDEEYPGSKADLPQTKSKSDAPKSSDTKSDDAKSDDTKDASATSASGDSSAADQVAKQDASAAVTADAIAVTIAVTIAAPATPAGTFATDKASAPLAIAAAAIAASAAVINATATDAATAVTDAGTKPTAAEAAAATASASATDADGTKTVAPAVLAEATTAQAVTAGTPTTAGIALAASAGANTPAASKGASQIKAAVAAGESATAPDATEGRADTSTAPIGDAPAIAPGGTQQAAEGKPKAENGIVDAVKADASGTTAPVINAAAHHGHAVIADTGQTPASTSGNGALGAGVIQAPQPSAAATPAAAAQLTVTAATSTAVPLSGVAMEIAASAKNGNSRFEIRLDPADLGRIDVRIDVDRNGHLTSHLTVEKPETLAMLRQDAPQLQRALDDAGFKTDGSGLQFSLRDQSSSGQNGGNENGRDARRLVISEDDTVPATAIAGRSYGRMLGSSSGVDIRV